MEILDTAHPVLPSLDLNFPDCQIGETFQVSFERGGGENSVCRVPTISPLCYKDCLRGFWRECADLGPDLSESERVSLAKY